VEEGLGLDQDLVRCISSMHFAMVGMASIIVGNKKQNNMQEECGE
jgi:hypothetical protein